MSKEGIKKNYMDEFIHHLKCMDRSNRTIETYIYNINSFQEYFSQMEIIDFDPTIITTIDILDYRSYCQRKKYHVNTINLKIASLSVYFGFLNQKNYIGENPTSTVKKLKNNSVVSFNDKAFSDKEFRSIRRCFYRSKNPLHILIFELLSKTGIRATSLVNLQIKDIQMNFEVPDARTGTIQIHSKGNQYYSLPLCKSLRKALYDWMIIRKKRNITSEYLLISEKNKPFTTAGIRYIVRKYHLLVNVQGYSLHSYRHFFAVSLLRNEDKPVDIITVSRMLGHHSVELTAKVYAKPAKKDFEQAVEQL